MRLLSEVNFIPEKQGSNLSYAIMEMAGNCIDYNDNEFDFK